MKDYQNLDHEIKKLSEPIITTLRRMNELLPDSKTMQDPEACKHIKQIVAEQSGINELQKAMAQFSHKIAVRLLLTKRYYRLIFPPITENARKGNRRYVKDGFLLRCLILLDYDILVTIFKVDDPDADPVHHSQ